MSPIPAAPITPRGRNRSWSTCAIRPIATQVHQYLRIRAVRTREIQRGRADSCAHQGQARPVTRAHVQRVDHEQAAPPPRAHRTGRSRAAATTGWRRRRSRASRRWSPPAPNGEDGDDPRVSPGAGLRPPVANACGQGQSSPQRQKQPQQDPGRIPRQPSPVLTGGNEEHPTPLSQDAPRRRHGGQRDCRLGHGVHAFLVQPVLDSSSKPIWVPGGAATGPGSPAPARGAVTQHGCTPGVSEGKVAVIV